MPSRYDQEMQKIIDAQRPRLDAEERAVKQLGDQIGYGRLMQAAETVWRQISIEKNTPGAEHTTGPCAAMMVPCPHLADKHKSWRDKNGHCDWCCGAGRVTQRVAKAMLDSKQR
jgi:excinuclease UvrABC ATPase subunit